MKRRSLGRGLAELLSGDSNSGGRAVIEVPVDQIQPNRYQPRRQMAQEGLEELVQSVRARGVLQPILVRRIGERYEIVAGERRWRASKLAELATVPCIIQEVSDRDALQIALIENLQREDLNAVEAARAYRQLMTGFGLTQDQLAAAVGKSRPAVANTMRLLDLPAPVLESIEAGEITEGHGRALLGLLDEPEGLLRMWRKVQEDRLNVRQTEESVRDALGRGATEKAPVAPRMPRAMQDPNVAAAEERLQTALATRVRIRPRATGGGMVVISYHDNEELDRLMGMIAPELGV